MAKKAETIKEAKPKKVSKKTTNTPEVEPVETKKTATKKTKSVPSKKADPVAVKKESTITHEVKPVETKKAATKKTKTVSAKTEETVAVKKETKTAKATKKAATKRTTKKVAKKEAEQVVELQPIEEVAQEETKQIVEEVSAPVVEEPTPTVSIEEPTPEAPKKKKKHPVLIAIAIILGILIILAGVLLIQANNVNDLKDKFDDINVLKAGYVDPSSVKNHDEAMSEAINKAISNIDINFDNGDVTLNAPKGLVYNIVDLDIINDAIKEYGITITDFGYSFDAENKVIDGYAAAKKWFITVGLHAQLAYEFTDEEIILSIKDVEVGNLPRFLYEKFIPKDTEIGRFNLSRVKVSEGLELKVFSPNKIKDIQFENNTLSFKYAIGDVFEDILTDLFETDSQGNSKAKDIANNVIQDMGFQDVTVDDVIEFVGAVGDLIGELIPIFAK